MSRILSLAAVVGLGLLALYSTSRAAAGDGRLHTVRIEVTAPEGTPQVYLAGNRPELGPWNPQKFAMTREDSRFVATLQVPRGTTLEFKFTAGGWEREALLPDGSVPGNHHVLVDGDKTLQYSITKFRDGRAAARRPVAEGSGVIGTLLYHYDVASRHLNFPRHVAVWLPPGYATGGEGSETRYPVLYMHDGQNLFDPRIANTGVDWGADEAAAQLIEAGRIPPIIIVGVFSTPDRVVEYNPLTGGDAYGRFLVEELKPMIDTTYRTRPEAKFTAVCGSSAGGLISIGLGWKRPDVFTRIAALSAHLPPIPAQFRGTDQSILDAIENSGPMNRSLRIYIDRSSEGIDAAYGPHHERFRKMLTGWGWKEDDNLLVRDFPNTRHTEADWRSRLPIALEFLFADLLAR